MRNKIKHYKKYKIGKSPTPLGKISIVLRLCKLRPRKDEILHSGVGDFPILYSPVLNSICLFYFNYTFAKMFL